MTTSTRSPDGRAARPPRPERRGRDRHRALYPGTARPAHRRTEGEAKAADRARASAPSAIPVGGAAAAVLQQGREYVDTISPERIVVAGSIDDSRYLLVESRRIERVVGPSPGSNWSRSGRTCSAASGTPWERGRASRTSARATRPPPATSPTRRSTTTAERSWATRWCGPGRSTRASPPYASRQTTTSRTCPSTASTAPATPSSRCRRSRRDFTAELLIGATVVPGSSETHSVRVP